MRQVPADKYNVAWFKLAEFVARGEKERALGLYRLLVHSFADRALAQQLEGDLLLSFNDSNAYERYVNAAAMYRQEGRVREAIAVYEHLVTLNPEHDEYRLTVLDLYQQLGISENVIHHVTPLIKILVHRKAYDACVGLLEKYSSCIESDSLMSLYQSFVCAAAKDPNGPQKTINKYISIVITYLMDNGHGTQLQALLNTLQELNPNYYQHAKNSMQ